MLGIKAALISSYVIGILVLLSYILFVYLDRRKLQQLQKALEEKQSEN